MSFFTRRLRRIFGPLLAGVLCVTWLAGPLLDTDPPTTAPVVETEHHPSSCPPAHDHTICTQLGANQWIAARAVFRPADRPILDSTPVSGVTTPAGSITRSFQRSRAPPIG